MADGVNPVVDTNLGPAQANPIAQAGGIVGIMNDLAEMRNRQNANLLFQQQMGARHQLGEDLAVWGSQGLSPEEQIDRASHQAYAPFVTPEIANFRQSNLAGAQVQQTQAAIAETKQRMYNAGLGPMAEALVATQGDPSKLGSAFKIATAGLPPDLQEKLAPAYAAMLDSVTGNLPKDPVAAHAKVQENLRNLGMTFGGLSLDKLYGASGGVAPGVQEIPSATGATTKAIVSGGGPEGTSVTPLGTGPSVAQAEAQKIAGAQAAGLAPTQTTVLGPQGQPIPAIISGGGSAGVPAVASPLLMGGPPKGPQGTPQSPGAPAPLPEPPKGPPNEATMVMGPSLASAEYLKKAGELGGNIQEEINANAGSLPTMAKRADLMAQALTEFQSGGLADTREGLAKLVQGLRNAGVGNITDDTIQKIANGSLSAQQVFQSLVSRAGVQALKADAQGTGRVMRSEVDRYLEMMGDTTDPKALGVLMNNLRYTLLVGYDQSQKFPQFKQAIAKGDPSVKGLDIADFPSYYNRNFDETKLETPKGIALGPIPAGTFKGSAGASRPPIESFFK